MAKVLSEQFNGDIEAVKREIKSHLGKNTKPTYQYKKLKELLPMIKALKGRKLSSIVRAKELLKGN